MTTDYQTLRFDLDQGISARAAIGLIVLGSDQTIEYEWRHLLDLEGVGVFEARLANSATINQQTLAAMEQNIGPMADLIRPRALDVMAFGCTSGAMVIGEAKVFQHLRLAHPGVACTTPITAGIAALKALGITRIGLLTPYVQSINVWMGEYIAAQGIQVVSIASFEHENDEEVARIDRSSIEDGVRTLAKLDAVQAVFVSCTSLRVAHFLAELEDEVGKPLTSSNHALAWHSLRLAGIADALPRHGRLFTV
jgi:maleate isomerase